MLLPFVAWAATALFFLFRPAYEHAYAPLEAKQYPLEQALAVETRAEWLELRYLRSILGPHLLVRDARGWQQLDPETLQPRPYPDDASLRALLTDAMQSKPLRYGTLTEMDEGRISTDTGVQITFDWDRLSFTQSGRDTRWINRMYSIHYLEWTGIRVLDRVLGLLGLGLLLYMAWSGARLAFGWGRAGRPLRRQQASLEGGRQ
ncbi:MAG TPA: hypothetical protein GX696_06210 [Pseudomonadaceae bacterium]|nr:hypothetical protein [Pseudomonadaceae bacterium]